MEKETLTIQDSNQVIDLKGKSLNKNILIKGPVSNIRIVNGTVKGEIRLRPNNTSGNTKPGYTERVRKNSPSYVILEDLTIDTDGTTHQVYFGVGSTYSKIINCNFKGKSLGPVIYLSPEGGHHEILNNVFDSNTGARREVLSIDGSVDNLIQNNNFKKCIWGGIYLYRNCGEKGTVRHQKPQNNKILDNKFRLTGMNSIRFSDRSGHQATFISIPYGIILGSRQGNSSYCDLDDMYDIGSGKSNLDFARLNRVIGNRFEGDWFKRHILDNDKNNIVADNN